MKTLVHPNSPKKHSLDCPSLWVWQQGSLRDFDVFLLAQVGLDSYAAISLQDGNRLREGGTLEHAIAGLVPFEGEVVLKS